MEQITVNTGLLVAVACLVLTVLGIASASAFAKKYGDAENLGSVLSISVAAPFFLSLCYLLWCIMAKIGASI